MCCKQHKTVIMFIYIYIYDLNKYIYICIATHSTRMGACVCVSLSTDLPTYIPIYPSIHLSICLSIYLSIYNIHTYIYIYIFTHRDVRWTKWLTVLDILPQKSGAQSLEVPNGIG